MKHGQIWSRIVGSAIVLSLLAACGGNQQAQAPTAAPAAQATPVAATAAPAAATSAPAAATAAPAATAASAATAPAAMAEGRGAGGTLRILYWQAPVILNPHLAVGTKDNDASRLIVEPLAAIGLDGSPVPLLVSEIPTVENGGVSKDFKTVTWKLKTDVKWSDGTPFTADDVVFTYDYCADGKTACVTSAAFTGAEKVEAVDASTVKVTWTEANPNPYQMFVSVNGGILQKKQFGACIGEKAATDSACQTANLAPIGTGPYKIREFKPGDVGIYDINENFRDPQKPFFKEVQFKGGGDATSAARAVFQTGDTDYAWNLQVEAAVLNQLIEQGGKGELLSVPGAAVERIYVNFANPDPALGDKRSEPDQPHPFLTELPVRQAIMMAIDRKTIAEQLYGPAGIPTCEIVVTEPYIATKDIFGGRNKCVGADGKPDVEGAKKLLEDAGWTLNGAVREKDGKQLVLAFQSTINPLRQRTQAIIKQNLADIGVQVNLRAVDSSVFFSSDAGNPDTAGKFYADLQMFTNNYEQPDPQNYLEDWTSSKISKKENGWRLGNYGRFSNAEYDKTFEDLAKELDPAKRKELTLKLNDILINDVAIIPLINRTQNTSGYSKQLQGITGSPWDSEMWNIADWTMQS